MRARRGDQEMGVTCISLSKEDSSTFLIGSESGGIFKCSTQSTTTAAAGMGSCVKYVYYSVTLGAGYSSIKCRSSSSDVYMGKPLPVFNVVSIPLVHFRKTSDLTLTFDLI